MIKLLLALLGLCDHKWKIIQEIDVENSDDSGNVVETFTRYHLQCEKCGNVKTQNMK